MSEGLGDEGENAFEGMKEDTVALLQCCRYSEEEDIRWLNDFLTSEENKKLVDCQDNFGRSPLHMAAANGNIESLTHIIEMAFPTRNLQNKEGNSALHYAAMNNHIACAEVLLKSGWSAACRNASGRTPLQEISEKNFDEMEVLLLKFDESVDDYKLPPTATVDVENDVDFDEGETDTTSAVKEECGAGVMLGTSSMDDIE